MRKTRKRLNLSKVTLSALELPQSGGGTTSNTASYCEGLCLSTDAGVTCMASNSCSCP